MSRFQTQSQWENALDQSVNSNQDSSGNKKGITVSKKTVIIVSFIVIAALVAGFSVYYNARSIEGVWIRQMDDNVSVAGMTVEVKREGGVLNGTIISMPAGAEEFYVGQVKWFGIKRVGLGEYTYYDLVHSDTYSYGSSADNMTVSSDGDQLTISTNNDAIRGAYQLWVKQKNE